MPRKQPSKSTETLGLTQESSGSMEAEGFRRQEEHHDDIEAVSRMNELLTLALSVAFSIRDTELRLPQMRGFARTCKLMRTLTTYLDIDGRVSLPAATGFPTPAELPSDAPLTYAAAATSKAPQPTALPHQDTSANRTQAVPASLTHTTPPRARQARGSNNRPVRAAQSKSADVLFPSHRPPAPDRLILRFDTPPTNLADCPPQKICDTINSYLGATASVRGVNITRTGNLVLFAEAPCTAEFLKMQSCIIALAVKQLWGRTISFSLDLDASWQSIVIQRIPLAGLLRTQSKPYSDVPDPDIRRKAVEGILTANPHISEAVVKRVHWMVSDEMWTEKLLLGRAGKPSFVSIRLDLSDGEVATRLLEDGLFAAGAHCRVARYAGRRRRSTSLTA